MNTIVTGARGFIGRHLCRLLRRSGDQVTELDLPEYDIRNADTMRDVLTSSQPTALYHLAAQANPALSWNTPLETWSVNVLGTAAVLEAARIASPHACILIMSTASVYDGISTAGQIAESLPVKPRSPYGISKAMVETIAEHYAEEYGMHVFVVRPFNAIGPGQRLPYLIPSLTKRIIDACRTNQIRIPIGNTEIQRDFVDVRDVVEALRLIVRQGCSGVTYNICSGIGTPIALIARRLIALSGVDISLAVDQTLQRPNDIARVVGDPSLVRRELGWTARIPLEVTLLDVFSEWDRKPKPS